MLTWKCRDARPSGLLVHALHSKQSPMNAPRCTPPALAKRAGDVGVELESVARDQFCSSRALTHSILSLPDSPRLTSHFELHPRIQLRHVRADCLPIKHKLGQELPRARTVLDAPARVTRGNEQARRGCGADHRPAGALGQVTSLLGLDWRGGQDRGEGSDVGEQVVAVGLVDLDEVCRLWQGNVVVGFALGGDTKRRQPDYTIVEREMLQGGG